MFYAIFDYSVIFWNFRSFSQIFQDFWGIGVLEKECLVLLLQGNNITVLKDSLFFLINSILCSFLRFLGPINAVDLSLVQNSNSVQFARQVIAHFHQGKPQQIEAFPLLWVVRMGIAGGQAVAPNGVNRTGFDQDLCACTQ